MCNGAGLWLVELFSRWWSLPMFTSERTSSVADVPCTITSAQFAPTHRRLAGYSLWHNRSMHDRTTSCHSAARLLHGSSCHREITADPRRSKLSTHRWSDITLVIATYAPAWHSLPLSCRQNMLSIWGSGLFGSISEKLVHKHLLAWLQCIHIHQMALLQQSECSGYSLLTYFIDLTCFKH